MERTINIDGKDVLFRVDGGIGRLYRFVFGRDIFADFNKVQKTIQVNIPQKEENETEEEYEARLEKEDEELLLSSVEYEILENIMWTMAKKADQSIPKIEEWLARFDSVLSVYQAIGDVMRLFNDSTMKNVKSKNG
jgi:hypothetical protein